MRSYDPVYIKVNGDFCPTEHLKTQTVKTFSDQIRCCLNRKRKQSRTKTWKFSHSFNTDCLFRLWLCWQRGIFLIKWRCSGPEESRFKDIQPDVTLVGCSDQAEWNNPAMRVQKDVNLHLQMKQHSHKPAAITATPDLVWNSPYAAFTRRGL